MSRLASWPASGLPSWRRSAPTRLDHGGTPNSAVWIVADKEYQEPRRVAGFLAQPPRQGSPHGQKLIVRLRSPPASATVAAVLCVLLLTQQPAVNLLSALGALAVGLVLYAVGRSRSPTSQDES